MLDRFLVIAASNRIPAVLVLNKIDLDPSALDALQRRYRPAGYQVLGTSVTQPEGLVALRDLLRGRESVLTGQSGVGKSSLLNALDPGLNLRIGEISAKWDTGKHTTRAALVVPVATGGYVVDTPRAADRKSTRLNSSHSSISYAVLCLKKKKAAGGLAIASARHRARRRGCDKADGRHR